MGLLAACAGWAALVLASTTWPEARQLDTIFPFYRWRTRFYSASEYEATRMGLIIVALTLTAITLALVRGLSTGRTGVATRAREIRRALGSLADGLRGLTIPQRWLAAGGLTGLTAVRLYFSLTNPEYDDAVSYEVFVSKGLLATSAFYPIPNNHVFSNTLSLLFYQVNPGF